MRQAHVAGDRAFVDYSGKRAPIVDPLTGEVRMAELFVAVLGAPQGGLTDRLTVRRLRGTNVVRSDPLCRSTGA
jgi:hypothetical protein